MLTRPSRFFSRQFVLQKISKYIKLCVDLEGSSETKVVWKFKKKKYRKKGKYGKNGKYSFNTMIQAVEKYCSAHNIPYLAKI